MKHQWIITALIIITLLAGAFRIVQERDQVLRSTATSSSSMPMH